MDAADYTNMLCGLGEADVGAIDTDRGDNLGIFYKELRAWWTEGKEFCLLWNKSDRVLLAVLKGEEEEVVETVDIIGQESTVISSLANAGDDFGTKVNAKLGALIWELLANL